MHVLFLIIKCCQCLHDQGLLTTKFPITTVARKNGMQDTSPTSIQSHMDSIHSPHSTRNTIMNECMKSVKFQRGISPSGKRSVLSGSIQRAVSDR